MPLRAGGEEADLKMNKYSGWQGSRQHVQSCRCCVVIADAPDCQVDCIC